MSVRSKYQDVRSLCEQPEKHTWYVTMLTHIVSAALLSYLVHSEAQNNELAEELVNFLLDYAGAIVPSIVGLADKSSNSDLGGIYLLLIWAGAPVYFTMFWGVAGRAYHLIVGLENATKFWPKVLGIFLISLIPIFFPRVDDSPNAVKTVAALEKFMNDFYPAFMVVGWSMMLATAMFMSLAVRWATLRMRTD